MAKRITVTGKRARRIEVTGKPQRRIELSKVAAALGAEPTGEAHASGVDPVALAAMGGAVIKRLRSTGGRPTLADATEICRVPLSADDLKSLQKVTDAIERSTGKKPSVGQVVGVIVREYLNPRSPKRAGRARENEPNAPPQSKAWAPQLREIASKIKSVQQTTGAIESAIKRITKDMKAAK
jgi:hypothetical protein